MSEQTPTPPQPTANEPKKKSGCAKFAIWGLVAFIVLVIIGAILGKKDNKRITDSPDTTITSADTSTAIDTGAAVAPSESEPEPTSGSGLGVSVSDITSALSADFDVVLGNPVDGVENRTGRADDGSNSLLQMLGPEDNLQKASIMTLHDANNKAATHAAGVHMGEFLRAIEPGASEWMQEQLRDSDYSSTWEKTTRVGGKKIELSYIPIGEVPTFTLTVETE